MFEKITFLIVFRLLCVFSLPLDIDRPELKIIGGYDVQNSSGFSYQVSLKYMGVHFCGGAIIDENFIVTAAHCCFDGENKPLRKNFLLVGAGNLNIRQSYWNRTTRNVAEVYVHPEYNSQNIQNDIALWKMSSPLSWTKHIQPIQLASRLMAENSRCNVSGWGVTDYQKKIIQGNLRYVELPIVSKTTCQKIYPSIGSMKVICAGERGKDSCQGDSGGPLVCNGYLTGVVSYGINCGMFPGVYTNIYAYRSWIEEKLPISSGTNSSTDSVMFIAGGIIISAFFIIFKLIIW